MSLTRRKILAALLAADGHGESKTPRSPGERPEVWTRTELYFATSRLQDPAVSEAEFIAFVDRQVTNRFPNGLTLLSGYGQFRNSRGELIRERSFLLILFYPRSMPDANRRIQEIREEYKAAFGQESVLRSDSFRSVSF